MKKLSTLLLTASILAFFLLIASTLILSSRGQAQVAEPSGGGRSPQATDNVHGGQMLKILNLLRKEGPRRHESYGDVVLRHIDDLKLSDEQIGRIARIHYTHQQKMEDIGQRLRETRKSAYEMFLTPSSDEAAIRQAAKDHTAAFDELVDTALKSRAAINAVLTPEQMNRLKSFKAEP
jgi:Spy/CpxP family protein refolding chaperone